MFFYLKNGDVKMKIMKINRSNQENLNTLYYPSPLSLLEIQATDKGVRSVNFVETKKFDEIVNDYNQLTAKQLEEYFNKKRTEFDLPFDFEGTDFQIRVWQALLKIPFGKTKSYMDIAKILGDTKAIRAVGTANGSNKIAIIVPCHRVIGSDGSLTGYAGGLERKKWLLDFEIPKKQGELF
jgi:methylated-DNA-[protein]-cysteine S-methyltransferase